MIDPPRGYRVVDPERWGNCRTAGSFDSLSAAKLELMGLERVFDEAQEQSLFGDDDE